MKVKIESGELLFWCKGCEVYHKVDVGQNNKNSLLWNNNLDNPTLSKSLCFDEVVNCEMFITNGTIQYFDSSEHNYAGRYVEMTVLN